MLTLDSDSDDDIDLQKIKAKNNIKTEATTKSVGTTKSATTKPILATIAKAPAKKDPPAKSTSKTTVVKGKKEEKPSKTVDSFFKSAPAKPELKVLPSRNKLRKSAFDDDDDFEDDDDDDFEESFD